jgi:hypothetical protein
MKLVKMKKFKDIFKSLRKFLEKMRVNHDYIQFELHLEDETS